MIYRFQTTLSNSFSFMKRKVEEIILMKFQQIIILIMSQNNNSLHFTYSEAVDLAVKEAVTFIESDSQYSSYKKALDRCQSFEQIFSILIRINKQKSCSEIQPQIIEKSCQVNGRLKQTQKSQVKLKLSTLSISSKSTSKSSQQSTLIQQIQQQQETIEQLRSQLQKTEKMALVCRKLQKEAYRNIDQSIDIIQKKDEIILKNNEERQILQMRIKQRDELLEQTLRLLEKRMK